MNAYPVDLVVELQPCVHASGLLPDDAAPPGLAHPPTEHPALCAALAEALAPRTRAALWTAAGAGERVRATLVHRDHTLPPARMRAGQRVPDAAARRALAALPPRSPLSPLFPGGPLFPDGLVTPSWIRKHGEYIPAVRLAFFCMPPDRGDTLAKDAALIEALTALRASLAPRGTRLVAVLLCEPVLYAQGVDARVAHVRRAAGLDTRGAVYALSTAAHADHAAFLRHIHTRVLALARDVYRERARHVRRHRARCPPPPSVVQPVLQAAAHAQLLAPAQPVLSAPGWNVRLFFKLGALAEWQADYGEARALYEDAYRELMDVYFRASPAKPPARRCVEAQVLADALVLRLVRLHLYAHAPARARAQLEQHIAAIDAQCAAWGLAPTAPERWAWPAKAYGLLAELAHEAQRPPSVHGLDEGLLYYHAALCHLEALRCAAPADAARGAAVSCLSAAYDAFRHTQRARLAHWAAVRLAQAYLPAKPAQALPFLERTLRWYRRDGWPMLRARLALTALAAALPCEDRAAVARLALELQQPVPPSLAGEAHDALARVPSEPAWWAAARDAPPPPPDTGAVRLVGVRAVFARAQAVASEPMPFQVVVGTARGARATVLALSVHLAGEAAPLVHIEAAPTATRTVSVGDVPPGSTAHGHADLARAAPLLVVQGRLVASVPGPVAFSHATLRVASALGPVELAVPVERHAPAEWHLPSRQRVPLPPRPEARALLVVPPPLDVRVPTTLLCGEVTQVALHTRATSGALVVALAPESAQAGAALGTEAAAAAHARVELPLADAASFWLRAPPTPSMLRLQMHSTRGGGALPHTQREHSVRVVPAFTVRAQVHWTDAWRGHVHADVQYVGDAPIELDGVCVDVPRALGVQAHATLGADDARRVWAPHDTGTWITPLAAAGPSADADAGAGAGAGATLRVAWRRAGAAGAACEAHWPLPPLRAPRAPAVRISVAAPADGVVGAPVRVTVTAHNTSAEHVADARLQVERVDACWLAGASRQALPLLLPHETRTLTWLLYPQRTGLCRLPVLRAWDEGGAQELPVHVAPRAVYVRLP